MGGDTKSRARVPTMGPGASQIQEGNYGRSIAFKHPDWRAEVIGSEIYQVATMILRGRGNDTKGRKSIDGEPQRKNVDR